MFSDPPNTSDLAELLVKNLKLIMFEHELNASGWAKAAGLNHTAVRDILTGKTTAPKYITLVKLAKAASVDVRQITIGPTYNSGLTSVTGLDDCSVRALTVLNAHVEKMSEKDLLDTLDFVACRFLFPDEDFRKYLYSPNKQVTPSEVN